MQILHLALFMMGNLHAASFSECQHHEGDFGAVDLICQPKKFYFDLEVHCADLQIDPQVGGLVIKADGFKAYAWHSGQLALVEKGFEIAEGSQILLATRDLSTGPCDWNALLKDLKDSWETYATSSLIGSSITCQSIEECAPQVHHSVRPAALAYAMIFALFSFIIMMVNGNRYRDC